jgi:NADH-quinone oxidoreductase subunit J
METGKNGYALPFEVISILLLAAMIGAIVIARKSSSGSGSGSGSGSQTTTHNHQSN